MRGSNHMMKGRTTASASQQLPVRIGLVGCGAQGQNHLRELATLGEAVEIAALCDLDDERLAAATETHPDAHVTKDFTGLNARGDLDLVIICTLPATHSRIAVAALRDGAHVLCEKPFAMNTVEAETILDAAEVAARRVQVGTNMRYMPHSQCLRQLMADGRLGKPLRLRVWGNHPIPPWWGPHYHRAVSGGGVLASTMVHFLDQALWICGWPNPLTASCSTEQVFPRKREPLASPEIRARYDVEDLVSAHVRFEGGLALQLDGNWCSEEGDSYGFELVCEKGTMTWGPMKVWVEGADGQIVDDTPEIPGTDSESPDAWMRSIRDQDADIVQKIRTGGGPDMQDRRQLLNLQRLVDACYESARQQREICI